MEWLKPCFNSLLTSGPIPKHIAFIMDGNRRFAERNAAGNLEKGHSKGFDKLVEALEWCLDLGVQCVTVYAFSIENYNRSQYEVDTLMGLADARLRRLFTLQCITGHTLKEEEVVKKYDVKIRVIGDLTLLPDHVRKSAEEACRASQSNRGPVLNICLSYLSSQEMAQALSKDASAGQRTTDFAASLYTQDCPPVDLLIRTSGESRLSDFMLWQSQHALLHFADVLWPDFSFWHLLKAIVSYQSAHQTQLSLRASAAAPSLSDAGCQKEDKPSRHLTGSLKFTHSTPFQARDTGDASHSTPAAPLSSSEARTTSEATEVTAGAPDIRGAEHTDPDLSLRALGEDASGQLGREIHKSASRLMAQPVSTEPASVAVQTLTGAAFIPPQAFLAPGRRKGSSRRVERIDRSKKAQFLEIDQIGAESSAKAEAPLVERAQQLRRNGMRGGYDSMEDSEDDSAHANGCPCCIVKFLPLHRICTDPTPAVRALRSSHAQSSRG